MREIDIERDTERDREREWEGWNEIEEGEIE